MTVRRTALLGAASACLAAQPAFAASAGEDAADAAAPQDVIVVSATRTRLSSFDYPGLNTVIDLETLSLQQPADLQDLLENVPGVIVGGGARRTGQTLSLRGFGRENVTLLLDGTRQNFASAHDGVVFLDPSLLRRVETVRGAGGSIYGSGAAGGVIAFETLQAGDVLTGEERFGARAAAGYRSVNEESRGSLGLFARAGGVDLAGGLSVRSSGDIELGSGDTLPAEDDILAGLFTASAEPAPGLRLEAGWTGFRNDAREPNNGQGVNTPGFGNALADKEVSADTFRGRVNWRPEGQNLFDVEAVAYRSESEVDETELDSGRFIDRDLSTTGVRLENRARFAFGETRADLVSGFEWYRDEQTGFDSETADNRRGGVPNGETTFLAGYAQAEITTPAGVLPGELILVPGVRFDSFESESDLAPANEDDAFSPRVSLTWAPNDNLRIFSSWSEAFRAPSLNELFLDGTHFNLPHPILGAPVFAPNEFVPNPDLRPEETRTIEIGAGFDHENLLRSGDRIELRGAVFHTRADDLINLVAEVSFDPTCFAPPFFAPCGSGVSLSENVADAELTGYEFQAAYTAGGLSVTTGIARTDGEDRETGEPLGSLQPLTGFLAARYRHEPWRAEAFGRAGFATDFDDVTDPSAERAGYVTLDLGVGFEPFRNRNLRIDVEVENLLDQDFDIAFAGASEPGRNVRIDLRWTGAI